MDTPHWITALGLFVTYPVLIVATVVLILFFAGVAWWLRGHWAKDRIAALEERLRLAADKQIALTRQVEQLQEIVPQLPQVAVTSAVASTVVRLSEANTALGATLTFVGGGYRLMVEPIPESRKPSRKTEEAERARSQRETAKKEAARSKADFDFKTEIEEILGKKRADS